MHLQHGSRVNDLEDLSIAYGLKEALLSCGFTRHQILTYTTAELASILEIDEYVASIIRNAAQESAIS
jgi:hypothetical protein